MAPRKTKKVEVKAETPTLTVKNKDIEKLPTDITIDNGKLAEKINEIVERLNNC